MVKLVDHERMYDTVNGWGSARSVGWLGVLPPP